MTCCAETGVASADNNAIAPMIASLVTVDSLVSGSLTVAERKRSCPSRSRRAASPCIQSDQPVALGWVERLVRRSSQSEGGSDTHQLHLVEMIGFAGSTHPTSRAIDLA
jgi:hypothetical protein